MTQAFTLILLTFFLSGAMLGKQAQLVTNMTFQQDSTMLSKQDSTLVIQQDSSHVPFGSYPNVPATQWKITFLRLLRAYIRDLFCQCKCPQNKPSTSQAK